MRDPEDIKRHTYWHRIKDDLEYIYKDNNLNRHWRKLDIEERRFISELIEYFDKRLWFIDDRMNGNLPLYTSYARDTNKIIDISDQYAKRGES